ncbi:hypothetical protein GALMADRAFT_234892, partial [Galerina marginata CBS 339.88]
HVYAIPCLSYPNRLWAPRSARSLFSLNKHPPPEHLVILFSLSKTCSLTSTTPRPTHESNSTLYRHAIATFLSYISSPDLAIEFSYETSLSRSACSSSPHYGYPQYIQVFSRLAESRQNPILSASVALPPCRL